VKYAIDYKYLPKGATAPVEIGGPEDIELNEDGFGLIPAVGDFVDIPGDRNNDRDNFRGRVRRRLFRYVLGYCHVNILIEEVDAAIWSAV
jgi:hypothetical protein